MSDERRHIKRGFGLIAQIVVVLVFIFSICFALRSHAETVLLYSGWGSAIVALLGSLGVIFQSVSAGKPPSLGSLWMSIIGGSFLGFIVVLMYSSLGMSIYDAYLFATFAALSEISSLVLVALCTLMTGLALFFIRLKWRYVYGASETAVGLIVASQRFYLDALSEPVKTPTTFMVLAILTAGVYLVVRGLDNIHQGLTKPPLDPFAQKLVGWLRAIGRKDAELGLSMSVSVGLQPEPRSDSGKSHGSASGNDQD